MLRQVEGAWNAVGVQTTWKLEPAYMYDDKDTTEEQPDQNEDSIGIILQHNGGESVADNNFASRKRSKVGLWEGMGTRWKCRHCECGSLSVSQRIW